MRRTSSPFNGKRYCLNKNTGVAHDLDNEKVQCEINKIKTEHVFTSDYYYTDIKSHQDYKEDCDYCLRKDG